MPLKVVYIKKKTVHEEMAAKELWEKILKPKWEAKAKAHAVRLFPMLKSMSPPRQ